jgi:hypothetical protein
MFLLSNKLAFKALFLKKTRCKIRYKKPYVNTFRILDVNRFNHRSGFYLYFDSYFMGLEGVTL